MRIIPRRWHTETWVCSLRGHCVPAAGAAALRPEDRRLGVDVDDGHRLVRCIRCDSWIELEPPTAADAEYEVVPPVAELTKPRRGRQLQDALLIRLIAVERAIHCFAFSVLAIAAVVIDNQLPGLKATARDLRRRLTPALANTGPQASHTWLTSSLGRVLRLNGHTLALLAATATVYAVVEGVEAFGLWRERRWAEYLTVLATAGFMPFEVREIMEKVTVIRVGALVLNTAILVWLVWTKHLFKVRGGEETLHTKVDWDEILSANAPAQPALVAKGP